MYPLRFEPLFQRYYWGGHKLAEVLQKPTGDQSAAESWEIVDHDDYQSVVQFGRYAGKSLRAIIADHGNEILGESALAQISSDDGPGHLRGRFPLLFKFLDAQKNLSVQVHPDDTYGATLDPPDLGKTEAWVVMQADPGAKIYAGLKPGVTKSDFETAIAEGTTESTLHSFEAQTGDCVFIPAGTIHALGAGLLIAEIQQASNTTFRVFDWNRVDADGKARPLHIQQALDVTDFERGPIQPIRINDQVQPDADPTVLVECDKFVLQRASLSQPNEIGGDGKFRLLVVMDGEMQIENDPGEKPVGLGEIILLPTALDKVNLEPGSAGVDFLEIHLP